MPRDIQKMVLAVLIFSEGFDPALKSILGNKVLQKCSSKGSFTNYVDKILSFLDQLYSLCLHFLWYDCTSSPNERKKLNLLRDGKNVNIQTSYRGVDSILNPRGLNLVDLSNSGDQTLFMAVPSCEFSSFLSSKDN